MIFQVMENSRDNSWRVEEVEEDQNIPPPVPNKDPSHDQHKIPTQPSNDPPIGNATLCELRASIKLLVQALAV